MVGRGFLKPGTTSLSLLVINVQFVYVTGQMDISDGTLPAGPYLTGRMDPVMITKIRPNI